ncbi:hypothetical protein DPMN_172073 [Dreissena polymorpha]|uniref:Uncharacterized protein n=1 Tax=Dreissena polymorpha TaxID=45954 RepID=A0A9D4IEB6_DREPO|nr:hypothetical protein DPMN_172073 [Dreissena polymorpha]
MVIVRRSIVISLHRLKWVGYGNFLGRLCKSGGYRHPSTRTSSPADFADSKNLEGSLSGMLIARRSIVVSLHRLKWVGYGNFLGWLCKSSEYRHPSTRTSSPADFANSNN